MGSLRVCHKNHCNIGHELHALTVVSTQPSTIRGMAECVSAFEVSNNKRRWWGIDDSSYRRTHSPGQLAWSEGPQQLGAVIHSSDELGELSQ